ncbi:unnamed protein product [Adineta steineri]|uniref:Uncharacterized protein n=1 Tax=Adineta steineri TaxID=433720 RepID=A0A814I6U8_9BILA|nr:unnamed protein product [Adineta steineri]CAF3910048.1 unnamed protein product [Adineta steineri]
MNVNSTQVPHSPTESSSQNNENNSNINQLLFAQTITTSQIPLISFNMTNMIPSQRPTITNTSEHNNRSLRREGRRRRRQRQRQRRRAQGQALQQRQQHIQQQQQQQRQQQQRQRQQQQQQQQQQQRQIQQHQQRLQQQRRQLNTPQRLQSINYLERTSQRQQERYSGWLERLIQRDLERGHYLDPRFYPSDHMEEPMDEMYNDPLIEAYLWETMDPKERWEQEQINELEKNHVVDPFEQLTIMQDELEQLQQIDHIQRLKEQEEQIQLQQWEQDNSIELKDPSILAYISQLQDDIQQLTQTDVNQTMDHETIENQEQ